MRRTRLSRATTLEAVRATIIAAVAGASRRRRPTAMFRQPRLARPKQCCEPAPGAEAHIHLCESKSKLCNSGERRAGRRALHARRWNGVAHGRGGAVALGLGLQLGGAGVVMSQAGVSQNVMLSRRLVAPAPREELVFDFVIRREELQAPPSASRRRDDWTTRAFCETKRKAGRPDGRPSSANRCRPETQVAGAGRRRRRRRRCRGRDMGGVRAATAGNKRALAGANTKAKVVIARGPAARANFITCAQGGARVGAPETSTLARFVRAAGRPARLASASFDTHVARAPSLRLRASRGQRHWRRGSHADDDGRQALVDLSALPSAMNKRRPGRRRRRRRRRRTRTRRQWRRRRRVISGHQAREARRPAGRGRQ